jgi:hypothetical protein
MCFSCNTQPWIAWDPYFFSEKWKFFEYIFACWFFGSYTREILSPCFYLSPVYLFLVWGLLVVCVVQYFLFDTQVSGFASSGGTENWKK